MTKLVDMMNSGQMLSKEREIELLTVVKNSISQRSKDRAKSEIISSYMKLVISIAGKMLKKSGSNADMDDLVSAGALGLNTAIDRYDLSIIGRDGQPLRLSTLASWWIKTYIHTEIMNSFSMIHPISKSASMRVIYYSIYRLMNERGWSFPLDDKKRSLLAEQMGVKTEDIKRVELAKRGDRSMSDRIGDGETEFGDTLMDPTSMSEDDILHRIHMDRVGGWIDDILTRMDPRAADVLRSRTLSHDPETLEAVGSRHGISKAGIKKIETKALRILKSEIMERSVSREIAA